ncbi:MAG: nuclear transport factor 2 family protein [Pseudomonadales bacterium]
MSQALETWHRLAASRDVALLDSILADEAVFHSPIVHTPQIGKEITSKYLKAAFHVLFGDTFKYVRELVGERDAVLEFVVEIDGIFVNGVDMITWNEEGQIIEFKVMVRPLKAINLLHEKMMMELQESK